MKYLPITNNEIFADCKLLNSNEKQAPETRETEKKRNRNHKPQTLKNVIFAFSLISIDIDGLQETETSEETKNNYLLIFARDRNRNIRKVNERNNKYIFSHFS